MRIERDTARFRTGRRRRRDEGAGTGGPDAARPGGLWALPAGRV